MRAPGCAWECLSHGFRSYTTVYGYVAAWLRRRLTRGDETLPLSSRAMIHWPIVATTSRTLTGPGSEVPLQRQNSPRIPV